MKKYVYFVCGVLHYSNRIILFREYEITFTSPISDFSDIMSLKNELFKISKECNDPDGKLCLVSVVNYKLLRKEDKK